MQDKLEEVLRFVKPQHFLQVHSLYTNGGHTQHMHRHNFNQDELEEVLSIFKPQRFLPVHCSGDHTQIHTPHF